MTKNIFLLTFLISVMYFGQIGNVGINTSNPQKLFHVDGGYDNEKSSLPSASQILNDVVITKEGNIGVAEINPAISFVARANGTSAERDGILIPKITRARAAAMSPNTPNATMVFITTLDGTMTGTVVDVNNPGFYYFDKPNNVWHRMQYNANNIGKSISTLQYVNSTFDAIPTKQTTCGKYIFRYQDVTGGSTQVTPQIALSETPPSSVTIDYGVETRFVTNGFEFTRVQRTFTAANTFQNLDATNLAVGELNVAYISYPGENLFYKVTFFADQNSLPASSTFTITCEIY